MQCLIGGTIIEGWGLLTYNLAVCSQLLPYLIAILLWSSWWLIFKQPFQRCPTLFFFSFFPGRVWKDWGAACGGEDTSWWTDRTGRRTRHASRPTRPWKTARARGRWRDTCYDRVSCAGEKDQEGKPAEALEFKSFVKFLQFALTLLLPTTATSTYAYMSCTHIHKHMHTCL